MLKKKNFLLLVFIILPLVILSAVAFSKLEKAKNITFKADKFLQIVEPKKDNSFTLISTGDIGLVRYINLVIQQHKDPTYPFLEIAPYLKDADITVTNLEGPLIKACSIIITGFKFCGDAANVMGLTYAGIDAANLANNHTTNYGLDGLAETAKHLKDASIIPFGQSQNPIEYINVKGKKIALVGFVELGASWQGLNNATIENVTQLLKQAKQNSDIVIATFHWGVEYTRKPTQNQIALAHAVIDAGGDLVLGNHPHWIQIEENYKGKFITYGQGNTIFDQDWSQETKEGVLYKFEYKGGKFTKIDEKYTIIEQNVQPRFATDQESEKIKQKIISGPQSLN
ncbi:MAG: CapA family protein [Candidatus Curtissbacteria bacterium]